MLAIYGDVDVEQARKLAGEYFGKGKTNDLGPLPKFAVLSGATGKPMVDVRDVKVQKTEQALAGIVIGFKSDSVIGDPTNNILDDAQTMAGGWDIRPGICLKRSAARVWFMSCRIKTTPGRNEKLPGDFVVYAGCDPSKVNEVVDQILLNIARLQGTNADMQEDWFSRSKLLITVADAMDQETPAQQASTAAAG